MRTVNGNWCEGSEVGRDGILRGAAQKKRGKKGASSRGLLIGNIITIVVLFNIRFRRICQDAKIQVKNTRIELTIIYLHYTIIQDNYEAITRRRSRSHMFCAV